MALLMLPVLLLALMIGINQSYRGHLRSIDDLAHANPVTPPAHPAATEIAMAPPALRLPSASPAIVTPEPNPEHKLARLPASPPPIDVPEIVLTAPALRIPATAPEIALRAEIVSASLLALPRSTPYIEPADPASGYACFPPLKAEARVLGSRPDHADFGLRLAAAARAQMPDFVVYDDRYRSIGYPMGDVPSFYGVCTDVVIRAYRALGYDLQVLVHEARVGRGDTSIDHRRTETLRRFFEKYGASLPPSADPSDYQPGDIVTYYRPNNRRSRSHIAVVADRLGPSGQPMIIHNRGFGVQMEDTLFMDPITGHYRYTGTDRSQSAQIESLMRPKTTMKLNASFESATPSPISATPAVEIPR